MKTIKQLFIFVAASFLLISTSCTDDLKVVGNGIQASEGRITGEFNRVKSKGAFEVHISQGDAHEVLVRTDENVINHIETYVLGETLIIETRGIQIIRNQLPIEVFITMPQLAGIKQSGSGNISSGYFSADDFDLVLSGSGTISTAVDADKVSALVSGSGLITVSGTSYQSNMKISGSGQIDAYDLDTNNCSAIISGSGNLLTSVEEHLDASISGSGNVLYFGNPNVDARISGSGKVIQNK